MRGYGGFLGALGGWVRGGGVVQGLQEGGGDLIWCTAGSPQGFGRLLLLLATFCEHFYMLIGSWVWVLRLLYLLDQNVLFLID